MATVYLALGSNLGDRWATLTAAVQRMRREPGLRVLAVSGFYETDPVGGPPGQWKYLNAAAKVETDRSPRQLLDWFLTTERSLGRIRSVKDAPRTLDLDILLYDDRVLDSPELTLPHPRMHERAFVLVPLAEIAADVVHPILKTSISELAARFPKPGPTQCPPVVTDALAGQSVLVTGSTAGIGAAIASAFAAAGASVTTHGRSQCPGRHITADLRDPAQVDRLANEAWGDSLDVLVCNAGADTLTGEAGKWSFDEKLEALLAVDVKGTIRLARTIGARMKARGRGAILTIGWDQAETGMEGDSGQLFSAAKGAVTSFTRSLALSLAPEVRVNCLAPGWIRTAWGETASAAWQERVRRETPLGVWGLPEDVAAAAVWLASPAATFVTGQTIRINGGAVR
jgi:2-amino-4-hydroxy-6-hydroxymethyldihydropteridine diphosphokinase